MFDINIYCGKNAITGTLLLKSFETVTHFTKNKFDNVSSLEAGLVIFITESILSITFVAKFTAVIVYPYNGKTLA